MSGHVFHPGHSELHGMTVVVETTGTLTYVGRYDRQDERGVHLLDVGVHDTGSEVSLESYIQRSSKYGVRTEHRHITIPTDEVVRITQLGRWESPLPQG
jgi:hypothetical protein